MITKISKKQEAEIPTYIRKWVELSSNPIEKKKVFEIAKVIFKKENPLIIFTESLDNTVNLIRFTLEVAGKKIGNQLDSQLSNQIGNQLRSQLYSQLYSQLDSQLSNQLYSQLSNRLYSQLSNQIGNRLGNQLRSQLRNQLSSQLSNRLGNQLRSQLYSQLYSQLDSQLSNQLYSQLSNQLYSQLSNQLRNQLYNQLRNQLGSQLSSQLDSQLSNQIGNQLSNQLRSQLGDSNYNFYVSYFWQAWAGYYDYGKSIGVQFDLDKLQEFFDILLNMPICIFVGNVVFICEKPEVLWDAEGMLHSEKKQAIGWKFDNSGFYYLHGVQFEKELWEKVISGSMSFSEILKIENTEQRLQAMRHNPNALMQENPKLIHESERGNKLYVIEGSEVNTFYNAPKVYLLGFIDPSKQAPNNLMYEEVSPEMAQENTDADAINAAHCKLTLQEYAKLEYES